MKIPKSKKNLYHMLEWLPENEYGRKKEAYGPPPKGFEYMNVGDRAIRGEALVHAFGKEWKTLEIDVKICKNTNLIIRPITKGRKNRVEDLQSVIEGLRSRIGELEAIIAAVRGALP